MTSRIASRRLALLPLRLEEKRAPADARHADDASSPTVLVAKVVLGALLVFTGLTVVALVPMPVAILALAGLSGLLALIGRDRDSTPRTARGAPPFPP